MPGSSFYNLVVLLLTLIITAQLTWIGVHDGTFELLLKMNTGRTTHVTPEEKQINRNHEDLKKRNEQTRSDDRRPLSNIWFVRQ